MKRFSLRLLLGFVLMIFVVVVHFIYFSRQTSDITKGASIDAYGIEKSALLVIGIQEGTTGDVSKAGKYKNNSQNLIRTVNRIVEASVENHFPVVYVRDEVSDWLIKLLNSSLAEGSPGAEIDRRLKMAGCCVITKTKQDAFSNPKLDSILVENRINKLIFVGLDAAYCIRSTIQAAKNRGYKITVIGDAVVSGSITLKAEMLSKFGSGGVDVMTADEYLSDRHVEMGR